MEKNNMSVLLFPWLGHGHLSPFLELGKKLSQRNCKIYLCSTPANLGCINRKIVEEKFSIRFVELHLPVLPNLPREYHTTNGLPPHLMDTLKLAFEMSYSKFSELLQNLKPDLLIYDFLQPWAPEAAKALNIPAVQFITSSTSMTCLLFHAYKNPSIDFPFSDKIYFREYEGAFAEELKENVKKHRATGTTNLVILSLERSKNIVLIKGFKEIDEKYLKYLSFLTGKVIVPVGPLVQEPLNDDGDEDHEAPTTIKWLDKKDRGSTIFISFGSEYFLSKYDFEEIAQGLMSCSVNFIWAVRFPLGEETRVEDQLPLGFYEEVGDRGIVVEGWVPQTKILRHASIGGFVSHCGWNSVIESMKFGVPIIAVPMHIDQPINARLVEEVGAGVEVLRNEDGKLDREKLARVIDFVVVKKGGEVVRDKVKELSLNIERKGDEEINEVVMELKKLCL